MCPHGIGVFGQIADGLEVVTDADDIGVADFRKQVQGLLRYHHVVRAGIGGFRALRDDDRHSGSSLAVRFFRRDYPAVFSHCGAGSPLYPFQINAINKNFQGRLL